MLFREDQHEALTAVHAAGAIEHRNIYQALYFYEWQPV